MVKGEPLISTDIEAPSNEQHNQNIGEQMLVVDTLCGERTGYLDDGKGAQCQTSGSESIEIPSGGGDVTQIVPVNRTKSEQERQMTEITVVFHVLVAEEWGYDHQSGDRLILVLEPPLSEFNYLSSNVEMMPSTSSKYADENKLVYLVGKLNLTSDYVWQPVPYKYVVCKVDKGTDKSIPVWEKIYLKDKLSEYNRSLIVPKDRKEYHRFDTVICKPPSELGKKFNVAHQYRIKAAQCVLSSIINVEKIRDIGVESAVILMCDVLVNHKIGFLISNQNDRKDCFEYCYINHASFDVNAVAEMAFTYAMRFFESQVNRRKAEDQLRYVAFLCVHLQKSQSDKCPSSKQAFSLLKVLKQTRQQGATIAPLVPTVEFRKTVGQGLVSLVQRYMRWVNETSHHESPWIWLCVLPTLAELGCLAQWNQIEFAEWRSTVEKRSLQVLIEKELEEMSLAVRQWPEIATPLLDTLSPRTLRHLLTTQECVKQLVHIPFEALLKKHIEAFGECKKEITLNAKEDEQHKAVLELATKAADNPDYEDKVVDIAKTLLENGDNQTPSVISFALDLLNIGNSPKPVTMDVYISLFGALLTVSRGSTVKDVLSYINKQLHQTKCKNPSVYDTVLKEAIDYVHRLEATDCFNFYLHRAHDLQEDWRDELLQRGFGELERTVATSVAHKLWATMTDFVKQPTFDAHKANATKIIEHFIDQSCRLDERQVATVLQLTETDLHWNMCRILQRMDVATLTANARDKCERLCGQICKVLDALTDRSILVGHFKAMFTQERWKRLRVVYEAMGDAKKPFPEFRHFKEDLDKVADFERKRRDVVSFLDALRMEAGERASDDVLKALEPLSPENLTLRDVRDRPNEALHFVDAEIEDMRWIVDAKVKSGVVSKAWSIALDGRAIRTESDFRAVVGAVDVVRIGTSETASDLARAITTVGDAEQLFEGLSSPDEIERETRALDDLFKCDIGDEGTRRIQRVFLLRGHLEVAAVVRDVGSVLGVENEFYAVRQILSASGSGPEFLQRPLSALTDDIGLASDTFRRWQKRDVDALAELRTCGALIRWIRGNIHTHQQLKVFVDLASIAAGESDSEVDRILVFQAALNGYAPLLFQLNVDGPMDHFIEKCDDVFCNLKANPKLPQHLADCRRMLPWIEEVHSRHGSVETSSLTTVQQINSTGVYVVSAGLLNSKGQMISRSMSDLITLTYEPVENDRNHGGNRRMNFADLDELRSKLMLITVGDDGRKEVDKYTDILCRIERIADRLDHLLQSGCSLFSQFRVTCYNYPRQVSMLIEFGHQTNIIRAEGPPEHELRGLAKFLSRVYDEWTAHIGRLRDASPSLNYYTTGQLVRLSSALASTVHRSEPLTSEAAILIRMVCSEVDDESLRLVFQPPSEADDASDGGTTDARHDDTVVDRIAALKKTPAFRELVDDHGYGEDVCLACVFLHVKMEGDVDIGELSEWCESHKDRHDAIREALLALRNGDETTEDTDDASSALEIEDQTAKRLSTIWTDYSRNVNDIVAKDFIGLQTMAVGLGELIERFGRKPDRRFPKYLRHGSPNLIVCPEKDAYKIVLAIYQSDDTKPLPGLDEILVCSSQTTSEQVELFCRRAFSDDWGKIFVVLHCHLLSMDVGVHVEKLTATATLQRRADYRLVFLSDEKHSDHSYVSMVLDKYSVTVPNPPSSEVLHAYVMEHLRSLESSLASTLDPDGCRFRLLTSPSPGNGKSLVARRLGERNCDRIHTLHLTDDSVCFRSVVAELRDLTGEGEARVIHVDVSANVNEGLGDLLFSVAVTRGIADETGQVWTCTDADLHLIEVTTSDSILSLIDIFPTIICEAPGEVLRRPAPIHSFIEVGHQRGHLMDAINYESPTFQRPYQYLSRLNDPSLEQFSYKEPSSLEQMLDCLQTLLQSCPVQNPSWRELWNFASFLNYQLETTERSVFCRPELTRDILPGFKIFVVKFLIQMSQDFASRSLEISDESREEGYQKPIISQRRKWENSPHPYVFFNEDGHTISFFGLHFDEHLNLVAEQTGEVLQRNMLTLNLHRGLQTQGVHFNESFRNLSRWQLLEDICKVFGVPVHDPDSTYELTYDNVMKLLATYTRLRCNIPVVVMGETGSGKTRLIRFLCGLLKGNERDEANLFLLKTHGGITATDIADKVDAAVRQAARNRRSGVSMTVLFFDEANTTNAIATVKTVLCDRTNRGKPIPDDVGLQFVAAVNPYREHSDEMIRKLESAGLGYHIRANETTDRIGKIPLRRLVYRVKELPASLFPLVWDFGTLDADTEKIYISQMIVQTLGPLPLQEVALLLSTLSESQQFMREQKDECSFVSLRDVERALTVLGWLRTKKEHILDVLPLRMPLNAFAVSLVLALGVAYYARLDVHRGRYVARVSKHFQPPYALDHDEFSRVIVACQDLFVNELKLECNIAKNGALKENVWIMAICIELKIPLFLVGKPGSSKSLAKTVVADVMQGRLSYSPLFRTFKEIHMVSFQCSPLATAEGILGTFQQCQKFQKERDLSKFASVVALDEVGLAEDSPRMPLKTLHPLLEDGCLTDEKAELYKKVAFVGLSNWALDPAKMNRGILVSRGVPSRHDLIWSACSIYANDLRVKDFMARTIPKLTDGYCSVYEKQAREYFGLRDFYSVVKMAFAIARLQNREPSDGELLYCVQRNFGGYFGDFDPAREFLESAGMATADLIPSKDLIMEAIRDDGADSRYLLLLTKNNAALRILQEQELLSGKRPLVLFGSSFRRDREYTQICRNINRIKMAMELGRTVVLCNLTDLYESLYDALNQNYVMLGGRSYVDLGLGTHRVKCRVHEAFRLIVVAEDGEVHREFPVPLVNRLEKHLLIMETLVSERQLRLVESLKEWVWRFCTVRVRGYCEMSHGRRSSFQPGDVFVGYHDDIAASLVLRYSDTDDDYNDDVVLDSAKRAFLQCTTPDAVSRLAETELPPDEKERHACEYHQRQRHACLSDMLLSMGEGIRLVQVTTTSRLLTRSGADVVAREMDLEAGQVTLVSLQQFDTEQRFSDRVKQFLVDRMGSWRHRYLFVQAEVVWRSSASLGVVECARYAVQNLMSEHGASDPRVVFILHVPRVTGGCFSGMTSRPWTSCHVDELRKSQVTCDVGRLENVGLVSVLERDLIDVRRLLIECIPRAASRSVNNNNDDARVQWRIERMMDLLETESDVHGRLLRAFRGIIVGRMRLLEQRMPDPSKWLLNVAIRSRHLKEGHTYQKCIWLHLCHAVTPILADIIAVCDMDHGMGFWVADGACTDALRETYVELLRQCPFDDLPRTVAHGASIVARFPFSRFLVDCIERWSEKTRDSSEWTSSASLQALMDASVLAKPLQWAFRNDCRPFDQYLGDFVDIKLPNPKSDEAKELLCRQLLRLSRMECRKRQAIREACESTDDADVDCKGSPKYVTPADVQLAYFRNKIQLDFLCLVVHFMPDVAPKLLQAGDDPDAGVDLHILAYQIALRKMDPQTVQLDTYDRRRRFCADVTRAASLFHRLPSIGAATDPTEETVRRLRIIRLYLQHVERCDHEAVPFVFGRAKRLNTVLKNNDLKTEGGFRRFLDFFVELNAEASKQHFAVGTDQCAICRVDPERPVLLPCDHLACLECLRDYARECDTQRECPQDGCSAVIPQDYESRIKPLSGEAIERHGRFKQSLTGFFVEVLQRHVFCDAKPVDEGVVGILMSFVVSKELPKDRSRSERTKRLSPFAGHAIDASPKIRSLVLQLLLDGGPPDCMNVYLEEERKHVRISQQHLELLLLVLRCLEDHYSESAKCVQMGRHAVVAPSVALRYMQEAKLDHKYELLANTLRDVSRVRLAAYTTAAVLHGHVRDPLADDDGRVGYLDALKNELQRSDSELFKKLLVRVLVTLFREDFILEWKTCGEYVDLMPHELLESNWNRSTADPYSILGERYRSVRAAVKGALLRDRYDLLEKLLRDRSSATWSDTMLKLVGFRRDDDKNYRHLCYEWACCLYFLRHTRDPSAEKNAANLIEMLRKPFPELSEIARHRLTTEADALKRVFPCANGKQAAILALLHQLSAVIEFAGQKQYWIGLWTRLARDPTSVRLYPTMPQDDTVEVRRALTDVTRFYLCPNGHPYGIGDCGRPQAVGQCATCGAAIGGTKHNFVGDGRSVEWAAPTDGTMRGHLLGAAADSHTERGLNGLQVALTRFVLHASMALACLKGPADWAEEVIYPKIRAALVPTFLMRHLELNLEQVATQLGRSEDVGQSLLHRILHRILISDRPKEVVDSALDDKEQREAWETAFAKHILDPEIAGLDECLKESAEAAKVERVSTDENADAPAIVEDDALNAILYEESRDGAQPWEVTKQVAFWYPSNRVTLENVTIKVGAKKLEGTCPNFYRLLKEEVVLTELARLPKILKLIGVLTNKFDGRIEYSDAQSTKISDFLYGGNYFADVTEQQCASELIATFIECFNRLKNKLPKVGLCGERAVKAFGGSDLSMDSSTEVLFPSPHHESGQCLVAVVRLLVTSHNWILQRYREEQRPNALEPAPGDISPAEMAAEHLVTFEKAQLHRMLICHSEYVLDVGNRTQWELDMEGLERSVIERFFVGRPLIMESYPNFHYQNEKPSECPLGRVIQQEPLSAATCHQLGIELRHLADTCNLLSLVEITRSLLLVIVSNAEDTLLDKMKELRLQLGSGSWKQVLKPLQLKHVDDLVNVLRLLRTKQLLNNRQDPFDTVIEVYKQQLDNDKWPMLHSVLTEHSNTHRLLTTIQGFILQRLCQTDPDPAEGMFVDYLSAYLEICNEANLTTEFAWIRKEAIKTIKNKHVIDVFCRLVLQEQ